MQKQYKPAHNYLLLQPAEAAQTSGLIIIPDAARSKINEGTIIAGGPSAGGFAVGQTVVYKQHSEYVVKIENVIYVVVSTDDVILYTDASIKS